MRTVFDPDAHVGGAKNPAKGKKRKAASSSFEDDITNIKRRNVKRLRHQASSAKKHKAKGGRKKH